MILFVCISNADITLRNVRGNLRCQDVTSGEGATPSSVGNEVSMNCNPKSNTYSRLSFDVEVGSQHTDRLEKSFYFTTIPGFGSNQATGSSDGCPGVEFSNSIYKKECVKMGLQLRTNNGNGYSIFPNTNSVQLAKVLNISQSDVPHIIEGYEISLSFGWTRWVYDLSNSVDHVFPFAYDFTINDTFAAYNETINNIQSQSIGLPIQLTKCYPNIPESAGRIPAVLGGCFRAPCNCSGNPSKPPGDPDFFTYEVNYIAPLGQVRKVLNNGQPRLSVDVVITLNAVVFLKGDIIYKQQMMQNLVYDITSKNPTSTGLGSVGSNSGVQNQYLRLYNSPNNMPIGSPNLNIDQTLFPGVTSAGALFKVKATLLNSYINHVLTHKNTLLGSTVKSSSKVAAPNLDGGYIIDFLTDTEVNASPYRTNTNSPYNIMGLPTSLCSPPDKFFYLSNSMIRQGVYFANNLRNSCGKIGTSSVATLLDIIELNTKCCNGDLTNGRCLPGFLNGNFPSPQQILANCSLYTSLFTPPGWINYNYYLIGRNQLNLQMPQYAVSGMNPVLWGPPTGVFDFVIEMSDILISGLVGNNAFNVNIPPLSLSVPNNPNLWFTGDEPFGCIYDSNAGGKGIFYIQQICNIGTSGGSANVSIVFDNCQNMKYLNVSLVSKAIPLLFSPLLNRQCSQNLITIPIVVDMNQIDNVTCEAVHFSSTYGSTKEITINNVQCYDFIGFFSDKPLTGNFTLPPYDCSNCAQGDIACWQFCSNVGNSLYMWVLAFFPLMIFVIAIFFTMACLCVNSVRSDTERIQREKIKTE